jgi:D-sedoheptulose 7-phosphate isomerase
MTHAALAKELSGIIRTTLAENAAEILHAGKACRDALAAGGQILVFGNGGSAAEAQHFVAELVNKFSAPRSALRAVSLTTDTSVLTSIGNDASFSAIFSRQIEGLGRAGDIALALSTSGTSANVVRGLRTARKRGLITIGLTGAAEGKMGPLCDFLFRVPSPSTPRVQEVHLVLLHLLVSEIERGLV